MLQFDVDRTGNCTVLRADGEIDALTGRLFADRITETFGNATGKVVVDLRGISFFGSPGIAGLVEARKVAERRELSLRIVCTDRAVLLPLTVTGLLDKFDVYSDLTAATS